MLHKLRSSAVPNPKLFIQPTFVPSENKLAYLHFIRNLWL